ncbi:hypothetical protein AAVH_23382 [Aphelenchoides avenae]|nr:hypothetical protein AAVH_23382 [Aphelenchus avenae]
MRAIVTRGVCLALLVAFGASEDPEWQKITPEENKRINEMCKSSSLTSRIIGGAPASKNEFKAAAVITNPGLGDKHGDARCGATLISSRHLLTSRSCFL